MTKTEPFAPLGNTVLLVANTTAPAGLQAPNESSNRVQGGAFRIQNAGSETVYLSIASNATDATAEAVIPTAGNSKKVVPISGGSTEIFSFGENSYFSGITATGAVNVFITPGVGV